MIQALCAVMAFLALAAGCRWLIRRVQVQRPAPQEVAEVERWQRSAPVEVRGRKKRSPAAHMRRLRRRQNALRRQRG